MCPPSVIVEGPIPSAPTNLTATPGNANALIAFTAPAMNGTTLSRYEYQLNSTTGTWVSIGMATSYTITNLLNGTSYTIYVRAFTTSGLSGISASSTVIPVDNSPIATPSFTMNLTNNASRSTGGYMIQASMSSVIFDIRDSFRRWVYYYQYTGYVSPQVYLSDSSIRTINLPSIAYNTFVVVYVKLVGQTSESTFRGLVVRSLG